MSGPDVAPTCVRGAAAVRAVALATSLLALAASPAIAAPLISRLTPPSELYRSGRVGPPVIARFLPGQRFDLQATVRLDAGATLSDFRFSVDGVDVLANPATRSVVTRGLRLPEGTNAAVVSQRAYALRRAGVHTLTITATQSDGQVARATGNFEIVTLARGGRPAKNIIIVLGDGMGAAHRTAARIVARGYAQGKPLSPLAMDSFPATAMVMTSSLDGIVTDSAPGMSNYVTGNKAANGELGVFPDDTLDAFDNPRVEYLSEYLHRTQGKALGIVTTADVDDATPAAMAAHTSQRSAGTGIVDQFLDDRGLTGLAVLMGGGRKWFLPNADASKAGGTRDGQPMNGSQRDARGDYALPADVIAGWRAAPGRRDPARDLIADFTAAGYAYAPDATTMQRLAAGGAQRLLGLYAYGDMNAALDKIGHRRGTSTVLDDDGLPDQPMLDEMTGAALKVLSTHREGFVALIEGASIDKQSHLMDSDRWLLEMVEFDRAVQVAKDYATTHPDTIVIVTADHECSGAAVIGASTLDVDGLLNATATPGTAAQRDGVVGVYEEAGFPRYRLLGDGYPERTDIDHKLLIGYGANADRLETWLMSPAPTRDGPQPLPDGPRLNAYPASPAARQAGAGFLVTGQVPGDHAVHTATDVPLSAYGRGASRFAGVLDNTDVFFKLAGIAGVR